MTKILSLEQKRKNRLNDAWVLYVRQKIDLKEYRCLEAMIASSDLENLNLAAVFIKEKFRNKKKDDNKSK